MTTPDNAVSDRAPETLDPDAYDDRLDDLANALHEFADQNGGWTGRQRKNVTTITMARGALDVELGYHDGEHSAFLAVRDRTTGARYLPARVRGFVLRDGIRHVYPEPRESFAAAVDQAAAELGLTPYAEESR
ncbi:hypothetical protein AB0B10_25485 [Micromonospora arborensis]|uniref:hypothetical protein n=1 Tax=Micromonospora arborensis TaxID=2116518 RepID=UPI0033DAB1CB